jgi:hypothetical protein
MVADCLIVLLPCGPVPDGFKVTLRRSRHCYPPSICRHHLPCLSLPCLMQVRSIKNRYGSTDEVGVFEMHDDGLQARRLCLQL